MARVSMGDIAKRTGVSSMTVSNVLNGRGKVGEATRLKILESARDLGYRKDLQASFNSSKRAKADKRFSIAFNAKRSVERDSESMHIYREIYFNLLEQVKARGWELSLTDFGSEGLSPAIAVADAVVELNAPLETGLGALPVPRVCVFSEAPGAFSVQPDNKTCGRLAAELLAVELGYERILVCTHGGFDQSCRCEEFLRSCGELAPSAGVEVLESSGPGDLGAKFASDLRERLSCPKARLPQAVFVLCGNSSMIAHGVLSALKLSVPDRIGLLGFDDFPFYSWLPVRIARYFFEPAEIASSIAQALEMAFSGARPLKLLTPVYFKPGDSLRAP